MSTNDSGLTAALHAEHVREFGWMAGDDLHDPVTAEQCGNCQRWGRYAADLIRQAKADALEEAAKDARERGDIGKPQGNEAWDYLSLRAAAIRKGARR